MNGFSIFSAALLLACVAAPVSGQVYSSRFGSEDVWLYDSETGVRIGSGPYIAAHAGLENPHGILDRTTDVLIASWTDEIQRYDRVSGDLIGNFVASGQGLSNPVYLEVGPDGSLLYVAGRFSTNVTAYNASTGAVVGDFSTSISSDSTFGLAVDGASGDIFVAVDGNVIRYDLSGGFPGVGGSTPPATTIPISGTAIGLEPSDDGTQIFVAAGTNLYSIAVSDNSASGPIFTSNDGSVHNFFHFSKSPLPPRSSELPVDSGILEVMPGPTRHLRMTFEFSEVETDEEAVVQLSDDIQTWTDAAVYSATGTGLMRDGATNSIQVGTPVDNGETQTITERLAASVSAASRGFVRVLRRAVLP
jgi:hypothetical protein